MSSNRPGDMAHYRGHESPVNAVAVIGDALCAAANDGTIKVWNLDSRSHPPHTRNPTLIAHPLRSLQRNIKALS